MGTVEVDSRGRITIPKELRERLGLRPGDRLDAEVVDGQIQLTIDRSGLDTATVDREWGEEAFLDAGEALFGADE